MPLGPTRHHPTKITDATQAIAGLERAADALAREPSREKLADYVRKQAEVTAMLVELAAAIGCDLKMLEASVKGSPETLRNWRSRFR